MIEQKTVVVNNQGLWTESFGDSSDAPVLLISGSGSHAHFWSDFFCQQLADHKCFVIRYDHRDVGLSEASSEEYGLEDLASDALGILDGYYLKGAHLVGHSMGGYIAQLLAAEHPERVKSVTTISSGPIGETPSLVKSHTSQEMVIIRETWSTMLKNRPTQDFNESLEGFMGVWRRLNGKVPLDEDQARLYTEEMYTRSRYPIGAHEKHSKAMQKMASQLKAHVDVMQRIHVPFLIIQGMEDYLVLPERGGQAMAEALPHAKLILIPKMGHLFFNQQIETEVAKLIVDLIDSIH